MRLDCNRSVEGRRPAAVVGRGGFAALWQLTRRNLKIFLKDKANWPLSLYLSKITAGDLGLAMVASLMMLAPPLLLFLTGRKYLEQGIGLAASINEGM